MTYNIVATPVYIYICIALCSINQSLNPALYVSVTNQRERTDLGEKGRDLTQSYYKIPYTHRKKSKKQRDNTKTLPKLRLHNDCGST